MTDSAPNESPARSWSSTKFRKILLFESIASMFNNKDSIPALPTPSFAAESRQESSSTKESVLKPLTTPDIVDEEIANGITLLNPSVSQQKASRSNRSSDGSGATLHPGEIATLADPMDNHSAGGINYRCLHWWQAGMLMIAETISLGILSLPNALSVLGLVPGLILLVGLGILASYTGYVIGQFKIIHPEVHSMGDAGFILFGCFGREVLGAGQLIFIVFIMGSHILTFSIMMNAITDHGACTIIFMVVGTFISLLFTLPRTLKGLTWLCVASFVSIITAVGMTMIAVSITKPGLVHNGLHSGYGYLDIGAWPQPDTTFHNAFLSVANIVFAYAGHVAFFGFISEFEKPREFPKALALLQVSDISMYLISSIVIYYYTGMRVKSPALDSASPLIRKIAYGLAMPTIVIAGIVNGHVAVKYLFVRLLRDTNLFKCRNGSNTAKGESSAEEQDLERKPAEEEDLLHSKGWKAWAIWTIIVNILWWIAWAISEGVPVFNDLLGLTSALFASWFTYGLSGMFFMHMNIQRQGWRFGWKDMPDGTKRKVSWKTWMLFVVNALCVLVGATICVAGLYSSGKSIAMSTSGKSFSCADNSV